MKRLQKSEECYVKVIEKNWFEKIKDY